MDYFGVFGNLVRVTNQILLLLFLYEMLGRYLKYLGYEVNYVRNFTDVDDKASYCFFFQELVLFSYFILESSVDHCYSLYYSAEADIFKFCRLLLEQMSWVRTLSN